MNQKNENEAVLYEGKYKTLLIKNGWEYTRRNNCKGIVAVLAVTAENNLVFVEQYRVPVGSKVIEFPAGLVDDYKDRPEESFQKAAARELEEETGYRAEEMIYLAEGPAACGTSTEIIHLYQATHIKKVGPGGGDASECIKVHEIPLAGVDGWLKNMQEEGFLIDPKIFAGLYFLNQIQTKAES